MNFRSTSASVGAAPITTRPHRSSVRAGSTVLLATLGLAIAARAAVGAQPQAEAAEVPFFNALPTEPQAILNRLFGPPSDAEKTALAEIDIPVREEGQLGRDAVEAYLAALRRHGLRVVPRGKDVAYIRELIQTLRPLTKNLDRYPVIEVSVVQSPRCDARVFPGGALVIFRGLLEQAGSEAALVGILGHELSHLARGHLLTRMRRIKLARQAFTGGTGGLTPEPFPDAGLTALRIWIQPFQPEDELEADRDGALWAYLAGYDPRETARLFAELSARPDAPRLPFLEFLQSHPPTETRCAAILGVYRELQRTRPAALYVGRENLLRRLPKSRQELPD